MAEEHLQKVRGDENSIHPYGVKGPLPFLKWVDYSSFAKGQIGFTKAFVLPVWE